MNRFHQLRQKASASYTQKILTHGPIPQGVDWSREESQRIRFEQLCKVIVATEDEPFSILLDYGCGYGALIDFLRQRYKQFDYTSFDISYFRRNDQRSSECISGLNSEEEMLHPHGWHYCMTMGYGSLRF
jgi:cyclopropane fatty-acyl-phospholipid synthase-like methyltransferase